MGAGSLVGESRSPDDPLDGTGEAFARFAWHALVNGLLDVVVMNNARQQMIDRHLRARGVRDPRVLDALGAVLREAFGLGYDSGALPAPPPVFWVPRNSAARSSVGTWVSVARDRYVLASLSLAAPKTVATTPRAAPCSAAGQSWRIACQIASSSRLNALRTSTNSNPDS